ncbi:ABC transporter permease subunit, partial [Streptomyces sp. ActVer]|uniref:ABC transporter permease subunit n=1 Tax=Streptomyces sp. ActVer TaxID=3014558 RepID=UPI0022B5A67E
MARLFTPGGRAALTRLGCLAAVLAAVGLLPWLSGRDPALTVLRARSAEQEGTPEALAAIRADLGLDAGPLSLLGSWLSGLPRGDLGTSWVSGTDVLPSVVSGLQVSLALMGAALGVALLVTCAVVAPVLVRGRGSAGAVAAMLAALPEFLLATVALLVCGVWLGVLPTSGWQGPQYVVLPAVALGVPAGGLLGRLVADALPPVLDERWMELWRGAGVSRARISAAALRRVLPPLVPQFGMVAVGLTGGAAAVETVFAVPGIGRTALGAAKSQDLPLLQGSVLALLALGLVTGAAAGVVRRRLLGPALVIADEPTTAQDPETQRRLLDLLTHRSEATGTTLVLITHDLPMVREHADRVLVMYAGRLVEEGPVEEVFARPRAPYTAGLLDRRPVRSTRTNQPSPRRPSRGAGNCALGHNEPAEDDSPRSPAPHPTPPPSP